MRDWLFLVAAATLIVLTVGALLAPGIYGFEQMAEVINDLNGKNR